MPEIAERKKVFETPWFDLIAKTLRDDASQAPYYSISATDYVCTVAVTPERELVLVRQYRPAVERFTLELPSGHVDPGEAPVQSATRELMEETGYTASAPAEQIAVLNPDTGRLCNKLWIYFAADVTRRSEYQAEAGIEVVRMPLKEFPECMVEGKFDHALHVAALSLTLYKKGKLWNR
jgi:ADP-ribose pyrophosphatase